RSRDAAGEGVRVEDRGEEKTAGEEEERCEKEKGRVDDLFRSGVRMSKLTGSKKATQFTESVIREMTRLNHLYGGVNLSQGFPDFPAPKVVKDAACAAIQADVNQYAVTWGTRSLREAI